ncbi:tetratricopeptide repeat protein [Massilia sp. W12]|uniref:tetratricopeptide repeat protein n=1 Tax=Massilia sp. W12 TaxID=3126507 RepID=UPI0030D408DD
MSVNMHADTFSWLHLTDLHFGLKGQDCRWPNLRAPFWEDLAALHQHCGPWDAVFFTGDLVQAGTPAEFAALQSGFLDELWRKLDQHGSGGAVLLAVPGNHDLLRPKADGYEAAVDALLEPEHFDRLADKFWSMPDGPYRKVIDTAFAPYLAWWQACMQRAQNIRSGALPGDFVCTLSTARGRKIGVMGLNTSFLQLAGGDYHGKLVWDLRQVHALCPQGVDKWEAQHDVCLLLSHQGPDWLTAAAQEQGKVEIAPAGRFAAHLFGHMHETRIVDTRLGMSSKATRHLQGASLFGMEKYGEPPKVERNHGYCAGKIEFDTNRTTLRIWPRSATSKGGWRFIPDHDIEGKLLADQGSEPCVIAELRASVSPKIAAQPEAQSAAPLGASAAPQARCTLPNRSHFYGRETELAQIASTLLPEHRGWGVALDGPGGMGKTALAVEAAYRADAEAFPCRIFVSAKHVRLEMDGPRALPDKRLENYQDVMRQLALDLLGMAAHKAPDEQLADMVRDALAGRRCLLVLDNLESFNREERRRIFVFLDKLPHTCRAIITSRRRDDTAARFIRLDQLDFDDAQKMLADLCKRLPHTVQLSAADQARLHKETGGNPLLMIWLVSQLGRVQGRSRNLEKALARMHDAQNHDPNNDPLEFVFGDLLDSFSEEELALLAALSHFEQGAKLQWLLPLCKILRPAAEVALDALQARSIVQHSEQERWRLPPLCGKFLRSRRAALVAQAGDKLAAQAYAWAMEYGGYSDKALFDELEARWPQIAPALPALLAGENVRLQHFCEQVEFFLDFSGRWRQGLDLLAAAEAKALAGGDVLNAGWRAQRQAWLYSQQGDGAACLQAAQRVAQHWQGAEDGLLAIAAHIRGQAYRLLQDYPAAMLALEQALQIYRTIEAESENVAIFLNNLAMVRQSTGDLAGAERDYRAALLLARELDYREGIATYTCNLAELALLRSEFAQAETLARDTFAAATRIGRQDLIAGHHEHLARALHGLKRANAALPHARTAVEIFSLLGSPKLAEAQATLAACEADAV